MSERNNRITKEELLKLYFGQDFEKLEGNVLRTTRVRVPGKSIDLAHIVGTSSRDIYHNLSLHIGTHEGEDHTGEAIGILAVTPWESAVIATDVAMKAANVEVGFMDRFSGSVYLTGELVEVRTAVEEVVRFFEEQLHFMVCKVTEN